MTGSHPVTKDARDVQDGRELSAFTLNEAAPGIRAIRGEKASPRAMRPSATGRGLISAD